MKSVCYSVTLVGMIVAHCAVAQPHPTTGTPMLESIGQASGPRPKDSNTGYPIGSGDPGVLQNTVFGGVSGEYNDGLLASQLEKPETPDQTQMGKPFKLFAKDSPQEILNTVGRYLNPLESAKVAYVSQTAQKMALSSKRFKKAEHIAKVVVPLLESLGKPNTQKSDERLTRAEEDVIIWDFVSAELTNTMFQQLYHQLANNGITPDGRPSPLDDQDTIDNQRAILELPGLVPALKKIYDDWCYVRFDEKSRQELVETFPLVGFALSHNAGQLWEVTKRLIKLFTPKRKELTAPFSNVFPFDGELLTEHLHWDMSSTKDPMVFYSIIAEITGALAAGMQFDKLGEYITEIRNHRFNATSMYDFLRLMALEFNLAGLVDWAIDAFNFNTSHAIRCSEYLGFRRAYKTLTDEYGQPQPEIRSDLSDCVNWYGSMGMLHLSPSPNYKDDTHPSISFRVLRSTLPEYHTIPKSAFEDQTVVEKLIKGT
ncbi:hypothetical protein H4R33_006284 [Dimargaris cristalligena]|uniref:F-box domain-containing protein n=1 Tax=Dimargaris cristalligena TaxID=215637 RepID=A0A4P9ZKX3_9FUNG|nr:hypothetical protein H4R33_006284 [Dimargaris cristalligena]RKP33946.1 hypothetical protein BJ085DRAFT_29397 [Dimargaris cristalligena]|eukprot:RKP33946.1 hypothetical protein BJ085DRAFT_29397 [Dimargaris cristalligena]